MVNDHQSAGTQPLHFLLTSHVCMAQGKELLVKQGRPQETGKVQGKHLHPLKTTCQGPKSIATVFPQLILHPQLVPQCGTIQIQTTLKW